MRENEAVDGRDESETDCVIGDRQNSSFLIEVSKPRLQHPNIQSAVSAVFMVCKQFTYQLVIFACLGKYRGNLITRRRHYEQES